MPAYHRTTVYLTDEQRVRLRQLTARAQLADLPVSASDLIRLAIDRTLAELSETELLTLAAAHVLEEVVQYPGRAKRGLPEAPAAATA